MYTRMKRYTLAVAISAVVLSGFVPHRLPSLYTFTPVREAHAQGQQGGGAMNIMMMIMMLMMMMSLAKNNDLQGKQGERMNDAGLRLLNEPNAVNPPGLPGGLPVNPQNPLNGLPNVPPQQPGLNINIPLGPSN
jgi:hypothetical protein